MNEAINGLIKEQFGTTPVSKKLWYVMTRDLSNIARVPVVNGSFHPAVLLHGIRGETKVDALMTFKRCFHNEVYAVVESAEEAIKLMPYSTIVNYDGKVVQRAQCD